jgi:hypothetical protein
MRYQVHSLHYDLLPGGAVILQTNSYEEAINLISTSHHYFLCDTYYHDRKLFSCIDGDVPPAYMRRPKPVGREFPADYKYPPYLIGNKPPSSTKD